MTSSRLFTRIAHSAVLLALLTAVTPLAGATTSALPAYDMMCPGYPGDPGDWCGGGFWDGTGAWGGTGMWGTDFDASWLEGNPQAFQAWLDLMAEHRAALQTWYDTYKDDLRSQAAQQALYALWQQFWNDMKAFYQQYANGTIWTSPGLDMWGGWMMDGGMMGGCSWDPSYMWGSGYGAEWMMKHPGAVGSWMHPRAGQLADVSSWWRANSSSWASTPAQTALAEMRARHVSQIKSFFKHRGLAPTKTRMRYAAGGWMGLGGMWGGWGW